MNGREYFHESVVRDIVDILTSVKDYDEVQFINNSKANRSFKSITSATKDEEKETIDLSPSQRQAIEKLSRIISASNQGVNINEEK